MMNRWSFHVNIRNNVLTESHGELIDGVVDYLFENCIDTVPWVCSISQPTDVHARPETDVLHALHRPDALISIIPGRREESFFHIALCVMVLAANKHIRSAKAWHIAEDV